MDRKMDFREIRHKFLDFFQGRHHEVLDSFSLVPLDDPSLLFINAGMAPFKRLFLGEEKRSYTRAATSQKCVRAGGKHNDLENVGYTARHHTFFEMLGNFSFGDYFRREAISWAWELLTEGYGLPGDRLYISVYKDDDEAHDIWEKEIGVPAERIVRLGEKDNFWTMGDTGPCGPCSEILIDQGPELACDRPDCAPGCDCDRYLEIWNLVFTQFDRSADGKLTPLPKPNIDTGMGLERLAAVVQGVKSNFDTDLFMDIMRKIETLSGKAYGEDKKRDVSFKVISDHARASAFLIGDGIMPSNEGRGYVLRRIIRRAIRYGQVLGMKKAFLHAVCGSVIDLMGPDYRELLQSKQFIEGVVENEEKRFADTLTHSMRYLEEEIENLKAKGRDHIPGDVAFKLYDTYGLSPDILEDVARDENLPVDWAGYETAMSKQRRMSQASWKGSGEEEIPKAFRELLSRGMKGRFLGYETLDTESRVVAVIAAGRETRTLEAGIWADVVLDQTPFYGAAGGQVGDTGWLLNGETRFRVEDTQKYAGHIIVHQGVLESGSLSVGQGLQARVDALKRTAIAINHSATHLLHGALRDVLGEHVKQAGSLVSPERLRFDFSHFTRVTPEKLREIEVLINKRIRENLPLTTTLMAKEEALKTGAMAIFEERYGEQVRLVQIGDGVSRELCGGTHTERTGDIGLLRIVSEGAVAANVRRIEALTGEAALLFDQKQDQELRAAASVLKTSPDQVKARIDRLLKEQKERDKAFESLKSRLLTGKTEDLLAGMKEVAGVRVVVRQMEASSPRELRNFGDRIKEKLKSGIILLGAKHEGRAMLTCLVTKDLVDRFNAGKIIGSLSGLVGGKGGGRPDMAQGGGNRPDKLDEACGAIHDLVKQTGGG